MDRPIAGKLKAPESLEAHFVSFEPALADALRTGGRGGGPAIVVAQKGAVLRDLSVVMIDAADVIAVRDGDWSNAILVYAPDATPRNPEQNMEEGSDMQFLSKVKLNAPELLDLAEYTIVAIRAAGVEGELEEDGSGRWVNRPINCFTLKAQPRVGNLQFTLYGDPEQYHAGDFLRADQNSYSRGWVRSRADAARLVELVRLAHARRKR